MELNARQQQSEPRHLTIARALIGTREAAGPANSKTIMGWAAALGTKILGIAYNADSVPWCGVFVAHCIRSAGLAPASIAVRAKAWATWGLPLAADRLAPGTVLVFERQGGGHVGFYFGEDATHYHVLGGNQGDAVNIMRLGKSRCIARRWPAGLALTGGPVWLTAGGAAVSENEA
jgi:uncharacterized protein (TIGR02594 family)